MVNAELLRLPDEGIVIFTAADNLQDLADILAYDEMLRRWTAAGDAAIRDWARNKRHEAVKALLPNHIAEYRRGKVVTAKGIGIQANEVFKIASDSRSSREDLRSRSWKLSTPASKRSRS